MGVLFDYHELWDVVESGVSALADNATEAQRVTHRDKKKKDKKALYLIHQGMTRQQTKVEKILRSLAPIFEHVVAAIEEVNDISTMTVRLLSGSLRVHEQRMNDNKIEKPIEQALQAQASIGSFYHKHITSQGRGRGRGGSYSSKGRGGQNHGSAEQNNIGSKHNPSLNNSLRGEHGRGGGGGIYNKSNVECYKCHKHDHYANECRSKGDNHAANCAQEDSCTNHMCGKKELFAYLDDSFRTKVKFGYADMKSNL
ncbi:uncharacterized protein [Phaseolus vulgaris]|uniref:uncharacterized protein n=1 Tax=Phaseolus vulgaris TaxID=3885 RepID=UPI0035CA894C